MNIKKLNSDYFRNIIFGAEDSLVSTVGVLVGVSAADASKQIIVTTGVVVIVVEALSMGAGAYLSETSTQQINNTKESNPVKSGLLMFLSYFFSGFVPLFPYIFYEGDIARALSVVLAILGLFFLGYAPQHKIKDGLRMSIVAGMAVAIGYLIGHVSQLYIV